MTRLLAHALLFVCAASLIFVAALRAQPSQPPNSASAQTDTGQQQFKIAGTVVNAITGAPLPRAQVSLADTLTRNRLTAVLSDENGHFEFAGLPPGKYSLQGSKNGYITAAYDQHQQFSTAIVTGPQFGTTQLVLRLMPLTMISGHVFDESGEPVRNARIHLFLEDHSAGIGRTTGAGGANTDDRGYFDIAALRLGTYFVAVDAYPWYATHPNLRTFDAGGTPPTNSALDVAYPTTFFGGATDSDAATPIELKGGERRDIDVRLTPVPALYLVYHLPQDRAPQPGRAGPLPMPILRKRVFDSVDFVSAGAMQQSSDSNGATVELSGVPAGHYEMFFPGSNPGQPPQISEIDLEHNGQDLSSTESVPLASLKLTLKMLADEPLPRQYSVRLRDSAQKNVAYQPGSPTGEVSFEGLRPGKYSILVLGPERQYAVVRTISPSGEAVSGHDVNLTTGVAMQFTAELVSSQARVEGVVEKNGKPAAGIMVVLVPKDPESHLEWFRRDQTDFDGTFLLLGVISGTYTIVAIDDAWDLPWMQLGVLARYIAHGQTVTVTEQNHGILHLPNPVPVQPH